ncbi:MAG TPA: DUF3040 domain-containing protein [Nocardioides sp.]|uniref:DUF3040 domain-containing protein n=1 Tax=Nocardioides sp. TaxID=35761 RepID=UPI002C2C13D2|nr:DUF3040 domain-containing protein [Nocardioides sp.]HQR25779.1 DUF3040 domain-containing protein [Nocardioides sp.]
MPLSEEELRLLEQMERALVQEDPKFASTLRGTSLGRVARRRAIVAGVCFLVGIAVLMGGVIFELTLLGIAGFVVMLASATIGLAAWRSRGAVAEPRAAGPHGLTVIDGGRRLRSRRSGSFMARMEERWQRRRDESGGF